MEELTSGTATEEEILRKLDALFEMCGDLRDELAALAFVIHLVEDFAERVSFGRS